MTYHIVRVDGDDEGISSTLTRLHEATFGNTAPIPHFNVGWWWLVKHEGKPVGFCGLRAADDKKVGYLKRAGVLHEARGQGLQRRMIHVRERHARREGMVLMLTDTTDNPASANTLMSAGYRLYKPEYRWALPNALYWRKEL
jgi:GNAT superfamily N-acetyltransferase